MSEVRKAENDLVISSDALQNSLNGLKKIMESSLDIICTINDNGRFLNVSRASERILGYPPEDMINKSFVDFIVSDDVEKTVKESLKIVGGANANKFENRYIKKDGGIVLLEWTISWDKFERVAYCIGRDITENKILEKSLEVERQRFRDLYNEAPSCMGILKGPNYIFEIANPLYLQLIGKHDIVGKSAKDVFPELESQGLRSILDKVYNTGETFSAKEMLLKIDINGNGKLVNTYLNFIYQAHKDLNDKIDSIFFFVNDVTEQVVSRKKIEESAKQFKQIVETAQEGIWLMDEKETTIFVNKKLCEILEYDEQEMLGKKKHHFMDRQFLELADKKKGNLSKEAPGQEILKFIAKSGRKVWASISANPLFNEDNSYKGSLAMVTDITESVQLNEELNRQSIELRRSNKELEQFAYIASHDLQEPLRMVKSFMGLLHNKYDNKLDEQARKYIKFAVDGATRMERLIKDLLNYSMSIDEENTELANVTSIIEDVIENLSHQIKKSNAIINFADLPQISLPRISVGQLFQNLISNAIKYQPEGKVPYVVILADEKDNDWQFSIQDNGIGISEQYSEKIFTIFKRLHASHEYSGTGIGLAVCKKITEKLNGRIWVESAIGSGSTFYFTIPKIKI